MMSVPVYEAKTRLSELLLRVQQGESITITRHGAPAARLVAVEGTNAATASDHQRQTVDATLLALSVLREGISLPLPLRDAIAHGRD